MLEESHYSSTKVKEEWTKINRTIGNQTYNENV